MYTENLIRRTNMNDKTLMMLHVDVKVGRRGNCSDNEARERVPPSQQTSIDRITDNVVKHYVRSGRTTRNEHKRLPELQKRTRTA